MTANRRNALRLAGMEIKTHKHSTSPFREGFVVPTIQRNKKVDLGKRNIKDEKGNQLEGKLLVPYERDAGRFIKLAWDDLQDLTRLSSTAIAVLAYCLHQALPKNDIVHLPAEEACAWCRFKQPKSFYDAINELIIYQYVARTEKRGYYFINPAKFYNGDRRSGKALFRKPKLKPDQPTE